MNFLIIVLLALVSLASSETEESARQGRFINYKKKNYGEVYKKFDLEETKRSEEYAGDALNGMYMECFAQISFSCVQKKVLSFINRMNRMEKFSVLGNYVSIVRTKDEYEPESQFQARLISAEESSGLDELMETSIDRFLNSHVFRIKVPSSFSIIEPSESRSYDQTTSLDFRFPYVDENEARKKGGGGGGGGGKMGKKMMMMMMMGLKAKFMMLGPLILGMAGIMAMKALIASVISLTISKIMIIKKLMKNKGGGGGGGHGGGGGGWESSGGGGGGGWTIGGGGGGGGWDRRSLLETPQHEKSWDASDLAYRAYSTVENLF